MQGFLVKKDWLLIISGLLWSFVGLLLIRFACIWMQNLKLLTSCAIVILGLISGLLIKKYGLSIIVNRNIKRIELMPTHVCVFAFQAPKSYLMIIIMISLGIFLRTYHILGKPYLSTAYLAMGLALFLSSFRYYAEYKLKFFK